MGLITDEYIIFLFSLYKLQLILDCYNEFLASFAILQP